jgi:hypothetical protein
MPSLQLEDLLRFSFSGAVFLLTLYLADARLFGHTGPLVGFGLLAGAGLLAGGIIYSLHRAILHPLWERWLLGTILDSIPGDVPQARWSWALFTPTPFEIALVRARWRRRKYHRRVQEYLGRWSSQTHLLYTVPLAYWMAYAIADSIGGIQRSVPALWVASGFIYWCAVRDDERQLRVELAHREALGAVVPGGLEPDRIGQMLRTLLATVLIALIVWLLWRNYGQTVSFGSGSAYPSLGN